MRAATFSHKLTACAVATWLAMALGACGMSSAGGTGGAGPLTTATTPGAARQAPGCPTAPVSRVSSPVLYFVYPSSSVSTRYIQPTMLCGAGFRPGEIITLRRVTTPETESIPGVVTVAADSQGAFAVPYGAPLAPPRCDIAGNPAMIQAQGNRGSQASIALPASPPTGCAPDTQP